MATTILQAGPNTPIATPDDVAQVAADLRYRIAEAGYATTGAKLPDGVTVRLDGKVVSYEIELFPVPPPVVYWRMVIAGSTSFVWDEDGTNGADRMYDYKFYDANGDEMQTIPNLLVPRALADRTVNLITAADGTASIDIELPAAVTVGALLYARDFFLDIGNSWNASDLTLEFTGLGVNYGFVTDADDDIGEMMTIAGYGTGSPPGDGARVRLYFTECAVKGASGQSLFHVARVTLSADIDSTTQGGN